MKRFLILFIIANLFFGCDDGNIEVVSFDLSNAKITSCNAGIANNFFLYGFKDKRAFLLQIPENSFKNELSSQNTSVIINGSSNKLIYREFSDLVSNATLCGSIPVASPTVTKEWNATGGTVIITTTSVINENITTGATRIGSYNHAISFKNVNFNTGNGEQKNDAIDFGVYSTTAVQPANFSSTSLNIKNCSGNENLFFKISGNQALILNVNQEIFNISQLGTPKTELIDGEINKINYNIYTENINDTFLCATSIPVADKTWTAQNATVNGNIQTGVIEVITENIGNNVFQHTIRFKNITLTSETESFKLGTDYLFGKFPSN